MPPAPSGEGPLPLGPSEGIPLPPGSCKYQHDSPKRQEPVLRNLKHTPLAVPEGPLPASERPLLCLSNRFTASARCAFPERYSYVFIAPVGQ